MDPTGEPAGSAEAGEASPNTWRKLYVIAPAAPAVAIRRNLPGPCFMCCSLILGSVVKIVVTSGQTPPGRTARYI